MRLAHRFIAVLLLFAAINVTADSAGFVKAPVLLRFISPNYCLEGAASVLGGKVTAVVTVSRDGTVSEVEIKQSSENRLDRVVIAAIRKWVFVPAMKNGQVVPAQVTIPVLFDAESREVTVDLSRYSDD